MSREQELINQSLTDYRDEAEREFKRQVTEKIKEIAKKQRDVATIKAQITALQQQLKDLTIEQIEVDLGAQ